MESVETLRKNVIYSKNLTELNAALTAINLWERENEESFSDIMIEEIPNFDDNFSIDNPDVLSWDEHDLLVISYAGGDPCIKVSREDCDEDGYLK